MLVLLLFIVAVVFIYIELFLPGGVFGLAGVIAFVASIGLAFQQYGPTWGFTIAAAELLAATILILIGLKRFPQSRAGNLLILRRSLDKEDGFSGTKNSEEYVGAEGETVTRLRPAGIARIDSERMDVVTEGSFIDKGMKVKVVAVEGVRIVVREVEDTV